MTDDVLGADPSGPQPARGAWLELRQFRGLLDAVPDALLLVDRSGEIVQANGRSGDMFGYAPEALVGAPLEILVPERHRERHRDQVARFFDHPASRPMGSGQDLRAVHKDGGEFAVDIALSAVEADGELLACAAIRDLTRRARLEQLWLTRELAEAGDRIRSQFLGRVSHELRTPLNAVIGFARLLQDEGLEEWQRESVYHISRAGQRLVELVDEITDISRLDMGELPLSMEPVLVEEVVREAVQSLAEDARGREVALDVHTEGETYVAADRQYLSHVLVHLLTNAVHYNHPGGRVRLAVQRAEGEHVEVTVRDTGMGIPAGLQSRLFVPFDRLDVHERSDVEGVGLGLALSQRLVRAMGGELAVCSADQRGSTVTVRLAAAEMPSIAEAESAEPAGADARPARQLQALYVEDNTANAALMSHLFAFRPGWRLLHAPNGTTALQAMAESTPDLVLLDLHLPDMDGLEVLHQLREEPRTQHTPAFVVSGQQNPTLRKTLLGAGADGFFDKPVSVHDILALIDELALRRTPAVAMPPGSGKAVAARRTGELRPAQRGPREPEASRWQLAELRTRVTRAQARLDETRHRYEQARAPHSFDPDSEEDLARPHAESEYVQAAEDRFEAAADRWRAAQERYEAARDQYLASGPHTDSHLDDLTGLLRRGIGRRELDHELNRARRTDSHLVAAFIDVDGLKRLNDTQGHAAGDQALTHVAKALATELRAYDLVIRYGGDEFLAVLADTSTDQAGPRLATLQHDLAAGDPPVSISIGLAESTSDDTVDTLIRRADRAMYSSRQRSRR